MPFDGTNARAALSVFVLDRMIEMFGDNGEGWACGTWRYGRSHCLMSALRSVTTTEGTRGSRAGYYLRKAIEETGFRKSGNTFVLNGKTVVKDGYHDGIIISFNDCIGKSGFTETIKPVLMRARQLAVADVG